MIRHHKKFKENKLIICVDFDGTLCEHAFPDIGEPKKEIINSLIELRKLGNKLILWTCRENNHLEQAKEWCGKQGLEFDAVNHGLECEFTHLGPGRKPYAHLYLDDKAIHPETFMDLVKTINKTLGGT